ncbi:integral membrane protein [Mycolicibacterium neworleansense]|uniref:Integral membrane protein n=1 Tax=Mycolicibacterium neworleansense TaxID=146018 RepID=A0A0H5RV49_9MYCO|nr:integral membrane protein [Mycolicibacterium neworleansense]
MRRSRLRTNYGCPGTSEVTNIDIDRDAAHDAAQNELAKPIYPRASPTDQISEWLNDLLYRITAAGSTIPGGWFTISVLVILVVVAVVVAVRIARRTMRTARAGAQALFDRQELSAAQHRSIAEQYAAQGDWSAAIRNRVRALARHLEEAGVLDAVPGRTATELARDAGAALPARASELSIAATTFNDVTYGERPGTESAYRAIAALDDEVIPV